MSCLWISVFVPPTAALQKLFSKKQTSSRMKNHVTRGRPQHWHSVSWLLQALLLLHVTSALQTGLQRIHRTLQVLALQRKPSTPGQRVWKEQAVARLKITAINQTREQKHQDGFWGEGFVAAKNWTLLIVLYLIKKRHACKPQLKKIKLNNNVEMLSTERFYYSTRNSFCNVEILKNWRWCNIL